MIKLHQVSGGYGKKQVIHDVSLTIKKGSFFSIIGPNGSGKTTLIRLISGELKPSRGFIQVDNKNLANLSLHKRAQKIAVLSQTYELGIDFTVKEIVSLGRYPYQKGFFNDDTELDEAVISQAMVQTNVMHLAHQPFNQLSGGEKQRVMLAKTFAQQPDILILDEPTNHLDVFHTKELLETLLTWKREKNVTIIAILHDINIASLYSDDIALLANGRFVEVGDASILHNEKHMSELFHVAMQVVNHPISSKPQLLLIPDQRN
jgi:iron complex transport system ATP-binding protein